MLKAVTVKFVHFYQCIVMFIEGLEISFWNAVFTTCVGHIREFPSAKRLTGLCRMLVGGGGMLGLYICVLDHIAALASNSGLFLQTA